MEKLLEMPGANLEASLSRACDLVADALSADKVDAFVHDPSRQSLVAIGVSDQPLSRRERAAGLDVLQLANRGRFVEAFLTGEPFASGRLDEDADEVAGTKEALGVRSAIAVPLEVDGTRRGVLAVAWQRRDAFDQNDVNFLIAVARWVGIVVHRAELIGQIAESAAEQSRQVVAEELITVLAHDLRNLLAPIELRFGVLRARAEKDGRNQDVHDCEGGMRTVQRLSSLIANVLDVARLDRGIFQLEPEALDLGELVRDVCRLLTTPEREIEVRAAESISVTGDAERVRQALENLVINALHHSPRGSKVTLRVSQHEGHAYIEIADEGVGIPHELLPRIFDRYVSGRPSIGLGLGLYMARRIARLHGGDLQVAANTTSGARFVMMLPLQSRARADG